MKHALSILCSALLLVACAGDGDEQAFETPVTASFLAEESDIVEVRVTDERPIEVAELVGPDGRVYTAHQILRDRLVEERGGGLFPNLGIGVGVAGGSSTRVGTSVGIGFPLGGLGRAPDEPEVVSRARIRIDDMAAYRADWQDWTVRLRLGEPATGVRFMEVPAPAPPPGYDGKDEGE